MSKHEGNSFALATSFLQSHLCYSHVKLRSNTGIKATNTGGSFHVQFGPCPKGPKQSSQSPQTVHGAGINLKNSEELFSPIDALSTKGKKKGEKNTSKALTLQKVLSKSSSVWTSWWCLVRQVRKCTIQRVPETISTRPHWPHWRLAWVHQWCCVVRWSIAAALPLSTSLQ